RERILSQTRAHETAQAVEGLPHVRHAGGEKDAALANPAQHERSARTSSASRSSATSRGAITRQPSASTTSKRVGSSAVSREPTMSTATKPAGCARAAERLDFERASRLRHPYSVHCESP